MQALRNARLNAQPRTAHFPCRHHLYTLTLFPHLLFFLFLEFSLFSSPLQY